MFFKRWKVRILGDIIFSSFKFKDIWRGGEESSFTNIKKNIYIYIYIYIVIFSFLTSIYISIFKIRKDALKKLWKDGVIVNLYNHFLSLSSLYLMFRTSKQKDWIFIPLYQVNFLLRVKFRYNILSIYIKFSN